MAQASNGSILRSHRRHCEQAGLRIASRIASRWRFLARSLCRESPAKEKAGGMRISPCERAPVRPSQTSRRVILST